MALKSETAMSAARADVLAALEQYAHSNEPSASADGWDDLSAGVEPLWTLEAALARMATAVPGTRNDAFAREAFIAGLRAKDLGLDPARVVAALIEAAVVAGSDDAKSVDTITRGFAAGRAKNAMEGMRNANAGDETTHVAPKATLSDVEAARLLARDAYRKGGLPLLARNIGRMRDTFVLRALARPMAAMLARDHQPPETIREVLEVMGQKSQEAARLAGWAIGKSSVGR
jgi:hypothetical protein